MRACATCSEYHGQGTDKQGHGSGFVFNWIGYGSNKLLNIGFVSEIIRKVLDPDFFLVSDPVRRFPDPQLW